jgi:hypothetical protein
VIAESGSSIGIGAGNDRTPIVISGGSVKVSSVNAPANGSTSVYLNTLTVGGWPQTNAAVTAGSINGVNCTTGTPSGGMYGIKDVTADGKVYFWLPEASTPEEVKLTANATEYENTFTRPASNGNPQTLRDPDFPVTLTVNKDGTPWSGHGKTFYLKRVGSEFAGSGTGGTVTFGSIEDDIYTLWDGTTDSTGITVHSGQATPAHRSQLR